MTLVTIGNPNPLDESEDLVLLSAAIRHDLRRLMSHGHCRYEISQKLYDEYKAAHGGRAPEDMSYTVKEYSEARPVRYGISRELYQIKDVYDDDGAHAYAVDECLVVKKSETAAEHIFDLGDEVGGSAMLELTRWLDTSEGHAVTGWFSFGEWRGVSTIKKELAALRGPRF
jgi:hypothetical protein